jgi:hypothetical protein
VRTVGGASPYACCSRLSPHHRTVNPDPEAVEDKVTTET